jgi:Transient receptor potential (TRP) ion channel
VLIFGHVDVTLTQGSAHPDPLSATYNPPPAFVSQFNSVASPTYLDPNLPNVLLNLNGSRPGMESWALAVGVRPQDVFGISVSIFLIIVGAILVISLIVFCIDKITGILSVDASPHGPVPRRVAKTSLEYSGERTEMFEGNDSVFAATTQPDDVAESHRVINRWWNNEALHGTVTNMGRSSHLRLLQGNLTRVFLVFHFPIVTFSVFQLSIRSEATTSSMALAGIAFVGLGLVVPAVLMWRVRVTSTENLQSDVDTLLALSPLYDTFGSRSYSFMALRLAGNIIIGIVIGAGQRSGTAQAVIILVYEIMDCLITVRPFLPRREDVKWFGKLSLTFVFSWTQSLRLPWEEGVAMGPLAFVISVMRILSSVLLLVVSPAVGIGVVAAGWIAYVILMIQGILFIIFFLIGLVKAIEFGIRFFGNVHFDETRRARGGGIFGAIGRLERSGKSGWRKSGSTGRELSGKTSRASQRPGASPAASGRPMLGNQRWSTASASTSDLTSYRAGQPSPSGVPAASLSTNLVPETEEVDDGYIMSAWQRPPVGPGYVAPGSYSAVPSTPSHRHSASWGEHSRPPESSFAIVRGGKASEHSPYSLERGGDGRWHNEYPPSQGPVSSSGYHSANSSTPSLGRQRAKSQSATIEFAQEVAAAINSHQSVAERPATTGTGLYSNSNMVVPPAPSEEEQGGARRKETKMGFFARLAGRGGKSAVDVSSDDEDETVENDGVQSSSDARRGFWFLGKDKRDKAMSPADREVEGGPSSFVVVRQPRRGPRPSPSPSMTNKSEETLAGRKLDERPGATEASAVESRAQDVRAPLSPAPASTRLAGGGGTPSSAPPLPPGAAPPPISQGPSETSASVQTSTIPAKPSIRPTSSEGTIVNEPPRLPELDLDI